MDRQELKRRMVEYKGGRCELCGYDRSLRALDFHHVEPSKKRFNIAGSHLRSWRSLVSELDKCILVCSNCHDEVESGVTAIPDAIAARARRANRASPTFVRRGPGRPAAS